MTEIDYEDLDLTAADDGDTDPDSLVGEEVEPEHDLDVDSFEEETE